MNYQKNWLWPAYAGLAVGLSIIVAGCGGGGSQTAGGGGSQTGGGGGAPPPPVVPAGVTALFHVNVQSGQVTITPSTDSSSKAKSLAIFSGTAVSFNSSVLLDQAGSTGLKTLSVSVTNNWGLPIGVDSNGVNSGFKVLFSNFTNLSNYPDPRTQSNVSTFAGQGIIGSINSSYAVSEFDGPVQVAVGNDGTVYVADELNNKIRRLGSGRVTNLAGNGTGGTTDGAGKGATFFHPFGICQSPVDGAIYVTDNLGNKVRRITTDGRVSTVAGTGTAGSTNGAGNVATFSAPTGLTIDQSGEIFVADAGTQIRKIVFNGGDPTSSTRYTVSNLAGSTTPGSADGTGASAQFALIKQLTTDPFGNLYVADQSNNKIRFVNSLGNVVTIAGTGTAGEGSGIGTLATFNQPSGIAYMNGAVFVSDSTGDEIRQLSLAPGAAPTDPTSWNVVSLAGSGTSGSQDGLGTTARFNGPTGLAPTASGGLIVAGFAENKIRLVSPNNGLFPVGVPISPVNSDPVALWKPDGYVPDAGSGGNAPYLQYPDQVNPGASSAARNWNFVIPTGVNAFDFTVTVETNTTTGTPPNGAVGAGSPNVLVRTFAGFGGSFGFVDGPVASARFGSFVQGLAADNAGNVYIADFHNNSIRRISPSGIVSIVAGTANTGGGSAVDGTGDIARFNGPSAVAVTPDGTVLYIGDANNNKIRRISLNPFSDPTNPTNWTVATIAGSGTQSTADGPGNVASLVLPEGVCLDSFGTIYASEDAGNRIKRIDFQGGNPNVSADWRVTTIAGDTSTTFPATGWVDGTGTSARFADPVQIVCDLAGNIYVADSFNNRIRKVTSGGVVTTVAGSTFGYTDATGAAAQFSQPDGLGIDASGYLYVADTSSQRIRMISPGGVVTTVAGTGSSGTVDGTGNIATFTSPFGTCVDSSGNVYVGGTDGAIRLLQRVIGTGTRSVHNEVIRPKQ